MEAPLNLADFSLDTDIEAAAALLERPRAQPQFAFGANLFHRKALIRPENALAVVAALPAPDDRTHCLLRGDFVLCDLIPSVIAERGACPHLRIATLGLSVANADTLAALIESGQVGKLTLVVSHYFQQVDKTTTFRAVSAKLAPLARLAITRSHAKVICLPTAGDHFVIEGSANLRSSDNIEQIVVTNDEATHAFHAGWLDELAH